MARIFNNWLEAYLRYTSASESPEAFHFWTGISVIASALRRRVVVDELLYEIVPNFYIILVGKAGVAKKSTTATLGANLLTEVPDIRFGPDSGSWQGIGDALQEAALYYKINRDDPDEKPRIMSAITVVASELGTFLTPDDSKYVSFLTDMWDGKRHIFRHRTKHSGTIEVENPVINIIGATTPTWIKNNVPQKMIGEGLMSRVIFVYADSGRKPVARPSKHVDGPELLRLRSDLITDLQEISTLVGSYQYTHEADEWMEAWYSRLHDTSARPIHLASDRYDGYIARKQTHLIKLAIVFAAAKRNDLVLELEDFKEAEIVLTQTEQSMNAVFQSIGVVDEADRVGTITHYVRAYGWITSGDLYQLCRTTMTNKDFNLAVKLAVQTGLLRAVTQNGKIGLAPEVPPQP
jgi:hypothetical protein